jgi:hypothetical protein
MTLRLNRETETQVRLLLENAERMAYKAADLIDNDDESPENKKDKVEMLTRTSIAYSTLVQAVLDAVREGIQTKPL